MNDICGRCKQPIYPDDEVVSKSLNRYHFECVEGDEPEPNDNLQVKDNEAQRSNSLDSEILF